MTYGLINYLLGGFIIGVFVGAAVMLAAIWINQKGMK